MPKDFTGTEAVEEFLQLYKESYGHLPTLENDFELIKALNLITLYDKAGWFNTEIRKEIWNEFAHSAVDSGN